MKQMSKVTKRKRLTFRFFYIFLFISDGHQNQEDICRWPVGADHCRRCKNVLLHIWKSKYTLMYDYKEMKIFHGV